MPMPNVVIAGERRSGTTSLAKWLEIHPDVFLHPRMDMAYFVDRQVVGCRDWFDGEVDSGDWDRSHSVEEYSALFDSGSDKIAIGEKSADYLFWKPAHERMCRYLPDAKYIITIRDPVERAWSHYWNEVGKGRETLSFSKAIEIEAERSERSAYARDHLSYYSRGKYDESLTRFFETIPLERVLVVILEECLSSPEQSLRRIFSFMGVDPQRGLDRAGQQFNANWTTVPRKWTQAPVVSTIERVWAATANKLAKRLSSDIYRQRKILQTLVSPTRRSKLDLRMPVAARDRLEAGYAPHIARLEDMLGRSVDCWRRAA